MKKIIRLIMSGVLAAGLVAVAGCGPAHMTTFTPEQEPQRRLNMNYRGGRINVAVGDFRVKARGATQSIGDGLREMLMTALFESRRFNVMDRSDVKGLVAEQSLSRSRLAGRGQRQLGGRMKVAEVLIYGAVTEFLSDAWGAGVSTGLETGGAKGKAEAGIKGSHVAIDVRAVDTATGQILAARRVKGSANSYRASLAGEFNVGDIKLPTSLAAYKNTPMERAVRDCIYRAVIYVIHAMPREYFRNR